MGQGTNLGAAQGSITINTSQLAAARASVQAFATGVNTTLTGVSKGTAAAEKSVSSLSNSFKQLAGALGISFGVAGVVQLGKMVIASTELATAYNRQTVAARNLAGSQGNLNKLLEAYDKASGGAVDKATALGNVTRLQATGFADSAEELDRFVRAVRGSSIAMGKSQEEIGQEVQLAISNQSVKRLDQIGLGVSEVKDKITELRAANQGMSQEAAFQEAVLSKLQEKFGGLADSIEGQKTGLENLTKAWKDYWLQVGQNSSNPINQVGNFIADKLKFQADTDAAQAQATKTRVFTAPKDATDAERHGIELAKFVDDGQRRNALAASTLQGAWLSIAVFMGRISQAQKDLIMNAAKLNAPQAAPFMSGISTMQGAPRARSAPAEIEGARQVHLDWAQGVQDLNVATHASIIDEERSFGASRAKTVADYSKGVARDEANYARGRLRANLDFLDSLADVTKDAARRESGQAADLARTQSSARSDSAEREADAKDDANKRLVKLDEDYEKDRIKAAKDLSDKLLDAAGNLDAKQVYELQRDAAKQEKVAADAHTDARKEIADGLKERLDDEAKSLAKSLRQQQEAYDRQISEGRENDSLRLEDMKAAFQKQQDREAEDHGIQVAQRAEDQAAQLAEMDTQHGLRMEQIANHAAAERIALDEKAKADLLELGVRNDAWKKVAEEKEKAQEKLWDKFMEHVNGTLKEGRPNTPQIAPAGYASGGYVPRTGLAYLHQGEVVIPARMVNTARGGGSGGRSIQIGDVNISVGGSNASAGDIGRAVREELIRVLEEAA